MPVLAAQGDWREQVKKDKMERKLRKEAVKLARFAKRNGIDHMSLGVYTRLMPSVYVYCDMGDGSKARFEFPQDGDADA
jgi:hypothetical protein